jgi:PIN domain nuclease of toxin-antitoxin system
MRFLIDTHTFIWLDISPEKISAPVSTAMLDPQSEIFLSHASIWEVSIKLGTVKLHLSNPLDQVVQDQKEQNRLQILPIVYEHILMTG